MLSQLLRLHPCICSCAVHWALVYLEVLVHCLSSHDFCRKEYQFPVDFFIIWLHREDSSVGLLQVTDSLQTWRRLLLWNQPSTAFLNRQARPRASTPSWLLSWQMQSARVRHVTSASCFCPGFPVWLLLGYLQTGTQLPTVWAVAHPVGCSTAAMMLA